MKKHDCLLDLSHSPANIRIVDPQKPKPEATPNIQEILRNRREMLNRVKADLERVGKLQQDFWNSDSKPTDQAETPGK
jgi:hypothetical protein